MPRSARIAPGGIIFHVLNRAAGRFRVLRTERDFLAFEQALQQACSRWPGVRLLGWCLMGNHWHLILWPTRDGEMKQFMHWLTLAHATRWRTSHGTVGLGPLYQGRYKSFAVQEDEHLLTVLRYVERNALRAGLVQRAEQWRWGSAFVRSGNPTPLSPCLHACPVQPPADWMRRLNTPQRPAEEQAVLTSVHRGRPMGDQDYQQRMAKRLGLISCFKPPGRPKKNLTGNGDKK